MSRSISTKGSAACRASWMVSRVIMGSSQFSVANDPVSSRISFAQFYFEPLAQPQPDAARLRRGRFAGRFHADALVRAYGAVEREAGGVVDVEGHGFADEAVGAVEDGDVVGHRAAGELTHRAV